MIEKHLIVDVETHQAFKVNLNEKGSLFSIITESRTAYLHFFASRFHLSRTFFGLRISEPRY